MTVPASPKSVEERLQTCEARLRAIVQHTPHVSIQAYAQDGRILFWNQSSEHVFGWRAEEAIGKKLEQLIFTEEEGARFVDLLRELEQTKTPIGPMEFRFHRRSGQEGWCLSTLFEIPGEDGEPNFMCMDVDITERKKAETALRASEELFSKAFSASPDFMSVSDLETGCYLEINDVHVNLLGFPRHEIIGRSPAELGILENTADYETFARELRAHGRVRDFEVRVQNRQGKPIIVSISAELVQLGGRTCVLRVSRDITERKQAEETLRQTQVDALRARQDFTQRLMSAQETERLRLAGELHDGLGQNLSLIKNRIHLALAEPGLPPLAINHLEAASKLTADALQEVRNLAHQLRPLPIQQSGLTDSLQTLVQEVEAASAVHFEGRFENVDELFQGEQATMVYRILQEALNNLVKHSRATSASVTVQRDLHSVRINIQDNGMGFDKQEVIGLGKIRTGIGLTSIDERVHMLGGSLDIRTGPGQGTALQLEIPLAEIADHTARDTSPLPSHG